MVEVVMKQQVEINGSEASPHKLCEWQEEVEIEMQATGKCEA